MFTIQLKTSKENSPICLVVSDYNNMLDLTYIFEKSKRVLVYNVSLHNEGLLKNIYDRSKWIDKSFSEYFGDD